MTIIAYRERDNTLATTMAYVRLTEIFISMEIIDNHDVTSG